MNNSAQKRQLKEVNNIHFSISAHPKLHIPLLHASLESRFVFYFYPKHVPLYSQLCSCTEDDTWVATIVIATLSVWFCWVYYPFFWSE
jgi:hypothetical protein